MLLSVDFGITITDVLAKEGDGTLTHKMYSSEQKPSIELVKKFFSDLNLSNDLNLVSYIALTGGHHQLIGDFIDETPVLHINEVDAIGRGGVYLSGLDKSKPILVVSSGSGTACVLAKNGKFTHCSGTGVGGGTVLGLSKLLLETTDVEEIQELANKGQSSVTNLILQDVVSGPIGLLPPETTAVNFGKIVKKNDKFSKEDLAAGIVNLVGETVARLATSVATAYEVSDIVVIGRTPMFTALKRSLKDAALLTNFTPHFPKNAEYASALGALLITEDKNPTNLNN